jgi:3-keto-5-aminohexanoate cleavage enzyme
MTTRRPVWIEASLNGPYSKAVQPNTCIGVEEIIEQGKRCFDAGAAILHFHAFDPDTGKQRYDADIYGRIIEGLRTYCDAILYPTVPMISGPDGTYILSPQQRYAASVELAKRGLLEWCVMDCGSVNIVSKKDLADGGAGGLYLNPVEYLRAGMEALAAHDVHPTISVWEPGFMRVGAGLHRRAGSKLKPIFKLYFSDLMAFGAPPHDYVLDTYIRLLAAEAPAAPWMVGGSQVDIRPLIGHAVQAGGHVRVGMEDAPAGTALTNEQWVKAAVAEIEKAGGIPATATQIRAELAA